MGPLSTGPGLSRCIVAEDECFTCWSSCVVALVMTQPEFRGFGALNWQRNRTFAFPKESNNTCCELLDVNIKRHVVSS